MMRSKLGENGALIMGDSQRLAGGVFWIVQNSGALSFCFDGGAVEGGGCSGGAVGGGFELMCLLIGRCGGYMPSGNFTLRLPAR